VSRGTAAAASVPLTDRAWFDRSAREVAPDLLGKLLVHDAPEGRVAGRIVEVEAYLGPEDLAAHSARGRTQRNAVMFGPPGHLYVYFTYGMHFCMNVVTGRDGEGSAVLLRAVEPVEGIELMRSHRAARDDRLLCSGPGRLAQAFGIGRAQNGIDLVSGDEMLIATGKPVLRSLVGEGPRVGIRSAMDRPWRLYELGNPHVSRVRGAPRRRLRGPGRRSRR
jgi:DNA-3-methyladenine glycosylase